MQETYNIYNLKDLVLSDINGDEYINRRAYLQEPILWWKNDVTQLNATNLNQMSTGIRDVQQEFKIECGNVQDILSRLVSNSAGWMSVENDTNTAEIFNDYVNNRAIADYSHAQGYKTQAGFGYLDNGTTYVSGFAAHAQGIGTVATSDYQTVFGKWNELDISDSSIPGRIIPGNTYSIIVGGGSIEAEDPTNWNIDDAVVRKNIYTLDWEGSGWFAKNINADGNVKFGTNSSNNHEFNGKVCFKQSIRTHSNLKVDGGAKVIKTLDVGGATTLLSTLDVTGATTLNNILNVSGNTTLGGTLDVTGISNLQNILNVTGATTLSNTLTVAKETTLSSTLDVGGNTNIGGTLSVAKETSLSSTLDVTGDTAIGGILDVTGFTTLRDSLSVAKDVTAAGNTTTKDLIVNNSTKLDGTLTVGAASTFNNNVDFKGGNNTVTIENTLSVGGTIHSNTDVTSTNNGTEIGLNEVFDHLDYKNLNVDNAVDEEGNPLLDEDGNQIKKSQTVPNAIAYSESKLIGNTELNTENLGVLSIGTLPNETIYGVAQFSINLVKSLLNAYILDVDNDDPEARNAIDKLIEVADWIKDDSAGAGKIISDISNLQTTDINLNNRITNEVTTLNNTITTEVNKLNTAKLDATTYTAFLSTEFATLSGTVNIINSDWNEVSTRAKALSNYTLLSDITANNISAWNTVASHDHWHNNLDTLDTLQMSDIENIRKVEGLANLTTEVINAVKADGPLINSNHQRLNALFKLPLNTSYEEIEIDSTVNIPDIKKSIDDHLDNYSQFEESYNSTIADLQSQINDLKSKLDNLIVASSDFDPSPDMNGTWPTNPNTKFVVKY